jgi:hypothetical protein
MRSFLNGRAGGARTHDLVVPNDARYQLRYSPILACRINSDRTHFRLSTARLGFPLTYVRGRLLESLPPENIVKEAFMQIYIPKTTP